MALPSCLLTPRRRRRRWTPPPCGSLREGTCWVLAERGLRRCERSTSPSPRLCPDVEKSSWPGRDWHTGSSALHCQPGNIQCISVTITTALTRLSFRWRCNSSEHYTQTGFFAPVTAPLTYELDYICRRCTCIPKINNTVSKSAVCVRCQNNGKMPRQRRAVVDVFYVRRHIRCGTEKPLCCRLKVCSVISVSVEQPEDCSTETVPRQQSSAGWSWFRLRELQVEATKI